MNKKIVKILISILYIFFIISMVSNTCLAIADSFSGDLNGTDVEPIKKILSSILTVIRVAGVFIAVAILMVVACKYIIASAGDRADMKKYAVSYIIGAIVLFAASGIATIIKNTIDSAFTTP